MGAIPLNTLIIPAVSHIAAVYGAAGGAAPAAMMGAIGLQESGFEARDQLELQNGRLVPGAIGPACGFWQFERGGAVAGVMKHPASRRAAMELSTAAGVAFEADAIWRYFSTTAGDELAAAFARLLLLTDPQALPEPTAANEEAAFWYYLRNWRPGAWFNAAEGSAERAALRAKWGRCWTAAIAAVVPLLASGGVVTGPSPVPPPPATTMPAMIASAFAKVDYDLAELKRAIAAAAL